MRYTYLNTLKQESEFNMRTTAKPVVEALQANILERFEESAEYADEHDIQYSPSGDEIPHTPLDMLVDQISHMEYNNRGTYKTALDWVEGGGALIYHGEVKDFLNSLGINPTNQEYTDDKSWRLYCHLVAREITKLVEGVK